MAATSISTTTEQSPLLGDAEATTPKQNFTIRRAGLSDLPILALHQKEAYWLSPINNFIFPNAEKYPDDMLRVIRQGIQRRFAASDCLSLVACISAREGEGEKVVGYGQFFRKGKGAKEFVERRGLVARFGLWVLRWWFWISCLVSNRIWPDRGIDGEAMRMFGEWSMLDDEKYWGSCPERHERWHASSVVVSPKYQGLGIGKLLMGFVIEMTEEERVPMGLTASAHGEKLYAKLGFKMLGDFSNRVGDEEGGGIMIFYPKGFKGKRHDDDA